MLVPCNGDKCGPRARGTALCDSPLGGPEIAYRSGGSMGVQYLMFYPGKQASKLIVRGLEWQVRASEAKTEEQGGDSGEAPLLSG